MLEVIARIDEDRQALAAQAIKTVRQLGAADLARECHDRSHDASVLADSLEPGGELGAFQHGALRVELARLARAADEMMAFDPAARLRLRNSSRREPARDARVLGDSPVCFESRGFQRGARAALE